MADAQAEVAALGLRRQLTFLGMIIQTSTTQHLSPFDLCFCMFFGHLSCAGYSLVHKDVHEGIKRNPSMDSHAQEAKLHGHVEPLADASTVPGPCPLVPPLETCRSLLQTAELTQSPWYLTKPAVQGPRLGGCWLQPSMEAKALLCFIIASNNKQARCLWELHIY